MKSYCTLFIVIISTAYSFAQVGINETGGSPHPNALLDVSSTTKGLLPPRMTTAQRDAITGAIPAGLHIYNTDSNCDNFFNGTNWMELCGTCTPPPPGQPSCISGESEPCAGETGVVYSVGNTPGVTYTWSFPSGWTQTGGGNSNSVTVTSGVTGGFISVVPSNTCGNGPSSQLSVSPNAVPATPLADSHFASSNQIVWNWQISAEATGYRYHTSNNYGAATDIGNITSYAQSGLSPSTVYSLYVWAYGPCGVSSPLLLSATTLAPWSCGSPLAVNHVAGDIAPINKSVSYGTVNTSITGSAKCWITQNLGSSQQATSATDVSEASSGWYWQFNRKQGYQYDGSRLPNTSWVSSITENSDWIAANDPCTQELGSGWRIPTRTEWTSADGAPQNWGNYNHTYASVLKIHCGGLLNNSSGNRESAGSNTGYWSSTQGNTTNAWNMFVDGGYSGIDNLTKAYGFFVRCLKD